MAVGANELGQGVYQMIPAQAPWRITRTLAGILLTVAFWRFAYMVVQMVWGRVIAPAVEAEGLEYSPEAVLQPGGEG